MIRFESPLAEGYGRPVQVDRVAVETVVPSDVITHDVGTGWWFVREVDASADRIRLVLSGVDSDQPAAVELDTGELVRRAEPGVVHHRDEFLGMTAPQAEAWAAALGWPFRNRSLAGFHTDDLRPARINVWMGPDGRVGRAAFG